MGIAKSQFTGILQKIFAPTESGASRWIGLYKTVPDESTEAGGVEFSREGGYERYQVKSGDFTVSSDTVTSKKNMMLFLCEKYPDGLGTARGFGIFESASGGSPIYFGAFTTPMDVGYNTVPTIKAYDQSRGEGVYITLTSTNVSATAE